MLSANPFVRVFAIDFSKAFDSIRHHQLLAKLSFLTSPDEIYNWVENFFSGRDHCTRFRDEMSTFACISASVVQGSALGPDSYAMLTNDRDIANAFNDYFASVSVCSNNRSPQVPSYSPVSLLTSVVLMLRSSKSKLFF